MGVLADIIVEALPAYRARYGLTPQQAKVCGSVAKCRTGELGWVAASCGCGFAAMVPCSCRDRHCPRCQAEASLAWRAAYARKLPGVPTYHAVFTVPSSLHPFFRADPRRCYGLLFKAAAATLQVFADRDPRLSGARLGMLAVLHTWGGQLQFHPHLHLLVCGGGLGPGGRWKALPARRAYLFSTRALSAVFRAKLLEALGRGGHRGPRGGPGLLRQAARTPWRVFLQRSRRGPRGALNYLGRYSHRVAVSPGRVVRAPGGRVAVLGKATPGGQGRPAARMDKTEFLRRFLQHVLPAGFRKVRAYGFLASGWQAALRLAPAAGEVPGEPGHHPRACPRCGATLRYFALDLPPPDSYAPP